MKSWKTKIAMSLSPIELLELRTLERGDLVGSDGRDWLRCVIGVTITVPAIVAVRYQAESVWLAVVVGVIGSALTATWIVTSGERVVRERIIALRARRFNG